jgi:hypothetical protein
MRTTRNAVIGAVHRHVQDPRPIGKSKPAIAGSGANWPWPVKKPRKRPVKRENLRPSGSGFAAARLTPSLRQERTSFGRFAAARLTPRIDISNPVHLIDLQRHQCRWVVGEPIAAQYCGAPVEQASGTRCASFCAGHAGLVYIPISQARVRRP